MIAPGYDWEVQGGVYWTDSTSTTIEITYPIQVTQSNAVASVTTGYIGRTAAVNTFTKNGFAVQVTGPCNFRWLSLTR